MNPDYLIPLSQVTSHQTTENTITFQVDFELFEIKFLNDEIFRFRISQGGTFLQKPSHSCIHHPWPGTSFKVKETNDSCVVSTSKVKITIAKVNFSVIVTRTDGTTLLAPHEKQPFYQYQNNHFVINRACLPHEHIYGLGEKTGHLDRHGRIYRMWNKDVLAPDPDKSVDELIKERNSDPLSTDFDPYYMSIGFYYRLHPESLKAAGYFIDNPFPAKYEFNNQKNNSHIKIHYEGGQYCEYFFASPKITDILNSYTNLTGRIELPPLWSLGYHQCRWKKYDHEDLLTLAKKQRATNVPCDVLWLDIDYMDEYRVFTWNDEIFPDREALFSKLKDMGFRIITIVDPGIKFEPGYEIFDQARENDLLCKCENGQIYIGQVWPGRTAFPDFSKPECRQWWGELNSQHVQSGIAGIWNDMNEPATGEISPTEMRFAEDDNSQQPHSRYHNEYALLMAMGTVEGLKKNEPNERTFVLSRAGSPGIQRYAANWMGDNASRWEHLQMSLPMAMGLGLSGQPFIGADIGGFVEPSHTELFIRWIQCGIFYPFCRNHNDHPADQYIWSFGKATQKICKEFLDLRYKLLPYIYTEFVKSHRTGQAILRPLIHDYQTDATVRQLEDQFLFGEALLIAPVLHSGQTARTVYLPKGEWCDMNTEKIYEGEKWISVEAPIDTLPMFAKCGSVIPMLEDIPESTMSLSREKLKLYLALPVTHGNYDSELFEDDGLTEDFHKGKFHHTQFSLSFSKAAVSLKSKSAGKGFKEFNRHEINVYIISEAQQAQTINLKNTGESFELDLKL
ncbi:MAG: glycoside hydrolase family 31 protein [Lentisphaerales bacterium]|nr:glycoside hydrolase family 31 protein [Lentisphaerales bacterium]